MPIGQSGEASWWRVCNQRGLPRLVSKEESEAMNPDGTGVGKFSLSFKVHKAHTKNPPERAIVSQCGSMTSTIGKFVDYHIKDVSTQYASYLQDTPHFIRKN